MKTFNRLPLALACLGAGFWALACSTTQLQVGEIQTPTSQGQQVPAARGVVYYLPLLEIDVEYKRRITQCPVSKEVVAAWLTGEVHNLRKIEKILESPSYDSSQDRRSLLGEAAEAVGSASSAVGSEDPELILGELSKRTLESLEDSEFLLPPGADDVLSSDPSEAWPRLQDLVSGEDDTSPATIDLNEKTEFKATHSVEAKPRYLPDHDHRYVIEYETLSAGSKETTLKVEKYASGTLKSLNADVEDRSAQIIASTLKGVLSVAAAANGIPVTFTQPASTIKVRRPQKLPPLCKADISRKITERKDLSKQIEPISKKISQIEAEIKAKSGELEKKSKELSEAKAALAELVATGVGPTHSRWQEAKEKQDELKKSVDGLESQISTLNTTKSALSKSIAARQKRIQALDKQLTHTTVITFRPTAVQPQEEILGADAAAKQWFDPSALKAHCPQGTSPNCTSGVPTNIYDELKAWSAIYSQPKGAVSVATKSQVVTKEHLAYREPAVGRLVICKKVECLDPSTGDLSAPQTDRLLESKVDVPQFGVLATLPLENKGFQNNNLVANFSETGALTKFEYTSNARLEAMAESFEGSAESIAQYLTARQEADKAALEQEAAEIDAERQKIEAQLKLEQALQCLEAFRSGETVAGCSESDTSDDGDS